MSKPEMNSLDSPRDLYKPIVLYYSTGYTDTEHFVAIFNIGMKIKEPEGSTMIMEI